jgi:glycerate dehydrogenase
MKIVVLDGYTLNPGDLLWDELKGLGECIVHDRTAPGQLMERARGAKALLTNKVILDRDTIEQLSELAYIGALSTGLNVIDLEAASDRGVVVTNVPAYGTDSVAQFVFALLLEIASGVGKHDTAVHEGKWSQSPDFCFNVVSMTELAGLTMGIIGFGAIGKAVARIAAAFGMKVIVHTRTPVKGDEIAYVDLDTVFTRSDVISLHCPLTPATEHLVNRYRLERMKKTAVLINTSRGPVVEEAALAEALNSGRIAGAAVDVLSVEPPPEGNPLLGARNCVVTPHVAWATLAARKRLMDTVVDNVRAWMNGQPANLVS